MRRADYNQQHPVNKEKNCLSKSNKHRVKNLLPNDLAFGLELGNAKEYLESFTDQQKSTINEAIECHQCKLLMDNDIPLVNWSKKQFADLIKLSKKANSFALRFVRNIVENGDFSRAVEEIDAVYKSGFWELFEAAGAEKIVDPALIKELLNKDISHLGRLLSHKNLTRAFDAIIRNSMLSSPLEAATLILDIIAVNQSSPTQHYLPSSLTDSDVAEIFNSYIEQENPHLNYLDVIAHWAPQFRFKLPGETLLAAKRKHKKVLKKLFSESGYFKYGVGVSFTPNQRACARISFDGLSPQFSYSFDWIKEHHDYATILNNFIHIFDFTDRFSNLAMPSHENDSSSLLLRLVVQSKADYFHSLDFDITDKKSQGIIRLYKSALKSLGVRLEDAISWFFNEYIESEFKIVGFHIDMPSEETTHLEKCKSLCSEIERVLKTFNLYSEKKQIDIDLIPYRTFSGFNSVSSLFENKYLRVNGANGVRSSGYLFSDQYILAYTEKYGSKWSSFFELILNEDAKKEDFADWQQKDLDWLESYGAIAEDPETKILNPTDKALVLYRFWNDGVIACHHLGEADIAILGSLVSDGDAEYYSSLFSDDESDYMSFNYDNRKFGNARAIRNIYSHGSAVSGNADSAIHLENYGILLLLIISVLLKINDELCVHFDKTNINDFVDWPFQEVERVSVPSEIIDSYSKRKYLII